MNQNIGLVERLRWRFKTLENKFLRYRLSTNETAVVNTEYGQVKGVKRLTVYDDAYYSFEGIPYAQPPVGELRFKAPQKPTSWTGVRDCSQYKDKALQVDLMSCKVEGSEDCLYLNVYTNNISSTSAPVRPVMVWIHGGGYISGEANSNWYGPDYFIRKDIVLVTLQYRVGVLGFLSLETPSLNVPGNAALKDQVMALRWVKDNCANFGGNPDCITVFGESAGSASTHYMMLTEQTRGLFHRAILMSGNALCPWATTNAAKYALTIARLAGYKGDEDEKNILEFLLNAKGRDLMRLEDKVLTPEDHQQYILFPFGPTVEPYVTPECVVPEEPREMMKKTWSNSIPVLMGSTSFEGLLFFPTPKLVPSVVKDLVTGTTCVPKELAAAEDVNEMGLKLKQVHVTAEEPTAENYLDLCSFKFFVFPLHRVALSRLAHAKGAATFLYRFDFDSEELIFPYRIKRWGRGVKGVSHADELAYLFWNACSHRLNKESKSYRVIQRMIDIWTKFAATGNPNDEQIDGMETVSWEPLKTTDDAYKCLNISEELRFIESPEIHKIKAWESLYEKTKDLLC